MAHFLNPRDSQFCQEGKEMQFFNKFYVIDLFYILLVRGFIVHLCLYHFAFIKFKRLQCYFSLQSLVFKFGVTVFMLSK